MYGISTEGYREPDKTCKIVQNLPGHEGLYRAPDKVRIFISKMSMSSPNPMFDHLLESSHRDDSNKWSSIGFGEEITQVESTEVHFTRLIWGSGYSWSKMTEQFHV